MAAKLRLIGFDRHPRGLAPLFATELWERFSYYGMRALLVLYLTAPAIEGGLAFATESAGRVYGNYTMAVYLLAIPGGFLADAFLGPRRAVIWGGLMIMCGHFALAVPTLTSFFAGLTLIALGSGLFKPSISSLVGALYAPDDERRDAGFSIFYMGINIGAFLAPLVTGFLAQSVWFKAWLSARGFDPAMSWHWGFAAAGVGMLVAMASFAWRARGVAALADVRPQRSEQAGLHAAGIALGSALLLIVLVISDWPGFTWLRGIFILVPAAGIAWFARSPDLDRRRLAAVLVFFVAAMVFWAVFEQAGVSVALFADQLTHNAVLGYAFPSAWYQALNPLFVIFLAPVMAALWLRLGARQPSAGLKFAIGLGFLAASLLLMVPAAKLAALGKVSPLWLVGLFLLQTVGELCISPVGLSTMTRLAPAGWTGLMLGVWFLAASWGSKLAGILGSRFSADDAAVLASFFLDQALMLVVATVAMAAMVPWLRRLLDERGAPRVA
jgi:POT family proton-dependent oligopeptide transporter